jgi:hypothetical protein
MAKQTLIKRFKAPTPAKWRNAGNIGLAGSVLLFFADQLNAIPHIIPFPEVYAPYVQAGIVGLGIIGKLLSNLAIKK